MRAPLGFLALVLVSFGAVAGAQDAGPSIRLDKILLDTENAGTTGFVKGGTMCVSSDRFSWVGFSGRNLEHDHYEHRFGDAMAGSGFSIVNGSQNLFAAQGEEGDADYLVGAIMLPRTAEICLTSGGRIKGRVVSDVQFQLFSTASKEVVYSTTYQGEIEYPKFRNDANLGTMLEDSFRDAAAKFATDPDVLRLAHPS
jgi:hypothetical protein